jgi:prepilin-type N-terminal cleavage/methylation domain-containing protein
MKKAFTLLEMLVVVAVLVTMMAIVFRLSSVASGSEQRNITASKLQRVEFCLSGYYAAYGSYPPVALHADRNIFREVDELGHQRETGEENAGIWSDESAAWRQVSAALAAQPMECAFPFASGYKDYVKSLSEILKSRAEAGMEGYEKFINPFDCGIDVRVDALEDIFRTETAEDFDNDEFFGHGTSYWRLTKDAYGITDNYSYNSKKYYTKMKKNIRRVKQLEKLDKRASWKHYDNTSYPGRYYITFEYNGNTYEIVTGHGVDSSKSFYTDNNMDRFGYTTKEKEFMRRYMEGAYD